MNKPESPENATQPDPASDGRRAHKSKLEGQAWRKRRLIMELARGEKTQKQLGAENGVAQSSISEFASRHVDEIEEARHQLAEEFDGVWIAQKLNRLIEMEALYENGVAPRERETRLAVLRAAAEELGQIPNRTTINLEQPVRVELTGINLDDV
jgi:hypothetical protein